MKHQISIFLILIFLFSACGTNKLMVGKKHYEQGEFYQSIENLREVYPKLKTREEKAEVVYMLGKSYEGLGEYSKSSPWLKNASRYNYSKDNLLVNFAEVQKAAGKLEESEEVYGEILEEQPGSKQARFGIKGIEVAKSLIDNPTLYQLNKMTKLNSNGNEKAVAILNEKSILISSSREGASAKAINPIDGKKFADIFIADFDTANTKWSFPQVYDDGNFNTEGAENHVHISQDAQKLVLSRVNYEVGQKQKHQLFFCLKEGDQWGVLKQISFSTDGYDYPQASWSSDGDWIYFSSNRSGGFGGYDIWKTQLDEFEEFGDPINLGNQINTKGNELYPTEKSKGNLYFSSNYHYGIGAQDIFRAQKERGRWKVKNMGFPLNSPGDDLGIQFFGQKEEGFFVSNRKGSRAMDVYHFLLPQKLFMCFGKVFNNETDSTISNVNIRVAGTDGSIKRLVTNNGEFQVELLPDNEYTVIAYKKGFLNAQAKISTKGLNKAQEFQVEFKQTPTDRPIRIEHIYYETGSWKLLTSSKKSLNELVNILHINPDIQIEVSAHTDEVGEVAFNMELSQKRADEVVQYLLKKGILADRMKAKGYGERRPFVINAKFAENMEFLKRGDQLTPEFISNLSDAQKEIAKSLNRRTEFEVIGE